MRLTAKITKEKGAIPGLKDARKAAVQLFDYGWEAREQGWTYADAMAFYGPMGACGWSEANNYHMLGR